MTLGNMSIRAKIGCGLGAISLLFVVNVVASLYNLNSISARVSVYDDANYVLENLFQAQKMQGDYFVYAQHASVVLFEESINNALGRIAHEVSETAEAQIPSETEEPATEEPETIVELISVYGDAFSEIVDNTTRIQTLKNAMTDAYDTISLSLTTGIIAPCAEKKNSALITGAIISPIYQEVLSTGEKLRSMLIETRLTENIFYMRSDEEARISFSRLIDEMGYVRGDMSYLVRMLNVGELTSELEIIDEQSEIYNTGFFEEIAALMAANGEIMGSMLLTSEKMFGLIRELKRDAEQNITAARKLGVIITICLVVLGLICSAIILVLMTKTVSKPLREMTEMLDRIAEGDFSVEKLERKGKDEIGMMADSLGRMIDELKIKASHLDQIGAGNLRIEMQSVSDRDRLGQSMQKMLAALNGILGQVNTTVGHVTEGSNQIAQASQSLSQGAAEQAASIEEISSSTNQINSQTSRNAQTAKEVSDIATQASADASMGSEQMSQVVAAMANIKTSAENIRNVVKVVDDIAFQTNILALNANIEAARAGKYGKSFAVVADEVRSLATMSAKSVKDTEAMVEDSIKSIDRGNQAVEQASEQLKAIIEGVDKVSKSIEEIALASEEQAQGMSQIQGGLAQIELVTQANTANAEESASAAEEFVSQSTKLRRMITQFKLKSDVSDTLKNVE